MLKQQTLEFLGLDYEYVIIQYYGEDDYAVVFTDDPTEENEGYSCRGTFKDVVEELVDMVYNQEANGSGVNEIFAEIVVALLSLEYMEE